MSAKHQYLAADQTLAPGDYLISPSGKYVACLGDHGQLGLCPTVEGSSEPDWKKCYWQSPVSPGSQPWGVMQDDGNFVLYNGPQSDATAYFASNTAINRAFVARVLDDGNLVVCTGVPPADPEEIVWSALPQISASCKFMQNYKIAVPVNGGPEMVAIRTTAGAPELFSIGTGGDVYNFRPDSDSETGYSQAVVVAGLKISHLAGATDSAGNVVLFASSGTDLYAVTGTSDPASPWGTPQRIGGAKGPVTEVIARTIGGAVWLLVMQKTSSGYEPAVLRWAAGIGTLLQSPGLSFTSPPPAFLQTAGSPAEATATFVTAGKIVHWGLVSGHAEGYAGDTRVPTALDVAADGSGAEWIVGVLEGQVYRLAAAASNSLAWSLMWPQISYPDFGVRFQGVVAETDGSGGVHVFAVSAQQPVEGAAGQYNVLYHRQPTTDSSVQPVPIYKSNGMRLAAVATAGSIDLFAVSSDNLVTRLAAEEDGSNWIEEQILLDASDSDDAPVTEFSSYVTDITLYDGDQSILSAEYVDVYASDRARVEINGLTFFIDEHTPAHVPTNDAGMLCITQETDSLASPHLQVQLSASRVSDLAPVIVVEPYADVHQTLGDQSADDLLAAQVTNEDGTKSDLLQGSYRDDGTPDSLAAALENFLGDNPNSGGLQAARPGPAAASASARRARTGRPSTGRDRDRFWSRQLPQPGGLRQASALGPRQPARLIFRDDGFGFERLTHERAAELRAHKLATLPAVSSAGFLKWISSVGDALRAVADGIVRVGEIIYNGISATLDLIIDGVTYVFDAIVELVQDAFDVVQMIFNHVKVFFQELYRWLAWLFDWTSIKQTKRCVVHSFDQLTQFFIEAVDQLRPQAASAFAGFKTKFATMMDDAIGNVAQNYTIGGYDQRNAAYDPDADAASSNNFFLNEFVSNTGSAGPTAAALAVATSDPLSALSDLLTQLDVLEEASTDSFNAALGYFNDLGSQPDQIFNQLFKGMLSVLKGIGLVGLDLAAQIVDALLNALSAIISALVQAIKQPLSIPFVSRFYKWIMKEDLTLLNLASLATAIPTAIMYAITEKEPLFTADSGPGSADEFIAAFTYEDMLQATGLAPAGPRAAGRPISTITPKMARGMASAYLSVTIIGGSLSGMAELKTVDIPYSPGWIPYLSYTFSALSAVFSFPWFYADTGSMDTEGYLWMGLGFGTWLAAALGTRAITLPAQSAENIRAMATTVAGLCLLAQAAYLSSDESDGRLIAWRILQRVPWSMNFLRHKTVRTATKGASLIVLVVADCICGYTSAVLGYLVLRERYDVTSTRPVVEAASA